LDNETGYIEWVGRESLKKSKVVSLIQSIEEHKKMIKTLNNTLGIQCKKLEEMTKEDGVDDIDISSKSGASAFSLELGEQDNVE
jgi:hypothetical protein